ncbi:MAG: hypothetical protein H7256_01545 [Bdellovibrio sp.]|nr:hypothetical protein [Bdellovibrio sp.]
MTQKTAIARINKNGILLVFPINNKPEPKSLWSEFYPKSKMKWEWDENGDNRVGELWGLMKRLSDSRQVVYSKWYQGRATFFSRELFTALLCVFKDRIIAAHHLSRAAQDLLETLEGDSPLSTKQLKQLTELRGKENESTYNRGMKQLFSQFMIVAFGEVEDGAFPSLAVGATRNLYEDLWNEALELDLKKAKKTIDQFLPLQSAVRKYYDKINQIEGETQLHEDSSTD